MTDRIIAPNSEHVVADVVEGEAIIINVATGIYYSSHGIGGWVWERLSGGVSLDALLAETVRVYAVSPDEALTDLQSFIADLLRENLVMENQGNNISETIPSSGGDRKAYVPPRLEIYRDMKDLLALDPPMPHMDLVTS